MAPFKDDQIIIIAPGSETTVAQLGLPESFTPAKLRVRSRMFPAEKEGEWEPYKVRRKQDAATNPATEGNDAKNTTEDSEEEVYEEDRVSEEGAVWPIQEGRIVNWSCFYALMEHVYNLLNAPFHTPFLLIAQPAWTPKEHERLTKFFFEKFKMPAFTIMDAALATSWAYGVHTATVVDVGKDKVDITAVSEFIPQAQGRTISLPGCGGEALTQGLLAKLQSKGFTREMCEQLKKNPICEILPEGTPLPGTDGASPKDSITNPAAAASTGATGSGPAAAALIGNAPRGPGEDTEVGDGDDPVENEGVLDVASIVAGGKMTEYLAKKEKEKQEKATAKKKGTETAAAAARAVRLPNSKREKATFMYEDYHLLDTLKGMNLGSKGIADAQAALDEGPQKKTQDEAGNGEEGAAADANGSSVPGSASRSSGIRREIEVGTERFMAASDGALERIGDALYRTIAAVDEVNKRSELWNSMIVCGNGSRVRGFKEALLSHIQSKYVISPSSATIFTSEIPSNISTPLATGANTPLPQLGPHGGSSQVNPLLLAATTAQNPHVLPPGGNPMLPTMGHNPHSSHGQTPTSVKLVKPPEYFPEWKEVGFDEAAFLGAQVAAKVIFIVDQGQSKGYMTRPDFNEQGPSAIHDYGW